MKKLVFIFYLLLARIAVGQVNSLADVVSYYAAEKNFNGVVLVATNGKIDYLNGMGISNRQSGTTINSKSKFKIASITKTFTAVLIMQLVEQGKVNLQGKIGTYLPNYMGEAKDKVTIQNLLTYSSGIPACEGKSGIEVYQKPVTVDDFIARNCSGKLESEPGKKISYGNGDYIILGKIIEQVTGKSFSQNLKEKILIPLGMENTDMLANKDIVSGLVATYTRNDSTKSFQVDEPLYIENFFASGSMYSTAEDLLKFDEGIFNHKLLTPKTVALMLTPYPQLGNVAIGFWSADKYGGINTKFVYRPGGIFGATANWIHVMDSNKSFILLSNTDATNLFEFTQQLFLAATNQKTTIPNVVKPTSAKTVNLDKVQGTWVVDLRPAPNSEAYFKDFLITSLSGKDFSGEFYGSAFTTGRFNTDWDTLYFAFTTQDNQNVYYHSGYIDGDKMYGISYSPERKFTSHWTGVKKGN